MRSPLSSDSFWSPTTNGSPSVCRRAKQPMSWTRERGGGRRLVVAREARAPLGRQRAALRLAVARDQRVAQLVVPRAGGGHDLALELAEVEVEQAAGGVDAEVHLHAVALAEHEVVVDRVGLEALAEQRRAGASAGRRRSASAAARRSARRCACPGRGGRAAAPARPAARAAPRPRRAGRRSRRRTARPSGTSRTARPRPCSRASPRSGPRSAGSGAACGAAAASRSRARVGLGGEQAEHPRLADDLAVGRDPPHADVVHPHRPVHAREPVGLGDDQQVALERPRSRTPGDSESTGTGFAYVEPETSARIPSPESGTTEIASSRKRYSR